MMTSSFWRALEQLGAGEFAACDWRHHLGIDWETCRTFLKSVPGHAQTVLDPEHPPRRLDVVPDGTDGFVGIVADNAPDGPPLPLCADDVAPLTPNWPAIAESLGKILGFTANRYENQGLTRQIGTAQNGTDPVRPVVLCLPAGHFGDHGRIANDLAARRDTTILLPSARWLTPQIQALASANRHTLISLVDQLAEIAAIPALATPQAMTGLKKRKKPLFRIQTGWRWDMLTIEVATGGRIVAACDGQRRDHRFQKSNSKTHSRDYEIFMHLAVHSQWRNPPVGKAENEAGRKRFYRFRETLAELVPIPGNAFATEGDEWKPNFTVRLHKDLAGERYMLANANGKQGTLENWQTIGGRKR